MGNCQAAEAATVLIEHPGGRVERVYCSVSANQVMASHPGYYVALIITSSTSSNSSGDNKARSAANTVKHLKLLRPDDTLHIGHVYRLVSFEDVLKEFQSRKHVRLSRLLGEEKERRRENHKKKEKKGGGGGGRGVRGDGGVGTGRPSLENSFRQVEDEHKEKTEEEEEEEEEGEGEQALEVRGLASRGGIMGSRSSGFAPLKHAQWRPTLQSIAEMGS